MVLESVLFSTLSILLSWETIDALLDFVHDLKHPFSIFKVTLIIYSRNKYAIIDYLQLLVSCCSLNYTVFILDLSNKISFSINYENTNI